MTDKIGAWERQAKICLVDVSLDRAIFENLLNNLQEENRDNEDVYKVSLPQIELALENLSAPKNVKFICMFVWDYNKQYYLPVCSKPFTIEDVDEITEIVKNLIEVSVKCCSDGFELVTFNESNKLLSLTIQALSENRMMQYSLEQTEGDE
jgi:hypothetical protein